MIIIKTPDIQNQINAKTPKFGGLNIQIESLRIYLSHL